MSTTTNCGNLHIRTPQTDSILVPNNITQSIVANGMRIGIIPETSVLGEFLYNIVIKNSINNIIFQNSSPIAYTGYGNYLYIIVPFSSLPNVGEAINIKLTSQYGCTNSTDYTVLSYTVANETTTININGTVSKYIKSRPSISYNGYFKDNYYFFKCASNTDTDDECFIQFKKNTDTSKILNALPIGSEVVSCPDSSDWVYVNTLCVSNTGLALSTTTVSTTTLIPCDIGLKLDNITFSSGTLYKIYFTSNDVQSITWKLFNNANVQLKTGNSGQLVTYSFTADFGTLTDGTYTLIIQSNNCSSSISDGTKTFSKGVPSFSTTTISGSTTSTTTISGSGVSIFTNNIKNVSGSIEIAKYYPQAFPIITPTNSTDNIINKSFPNWAVMWQVESSNFKLANRTVQDVGISFNYDMNGNYGSYGVRCLDYVLEQDPNTGLPWNIDDNCTGSIYDARYAGLSHSWQNFTSRIPFENKANSGYGITTEDDVSIRWDTKLTGTNIKSHTWIFDRGIEAVASRRYGHGDMVGNKVNMGIINADVENGEELGENGSNNHLAFAMGMATGSLGYVFSQYSAPLNVVYQQPSLYPEANGTYLSYKKNLDGSIKYWVNPNTFATEPDPNNIPSSNDWNPTNKLTITGRIVNKGLIDYPTFLPCSEISSTSDMAFRHGEIYKRTSEGATRVVNKFGLTANTNHIIADIIQGGDVNKWYINNKFDQRKVVLQTKLTCDRANMGIFYDAGFTNEALKFKHYDRRYSFMMGGITALLGCEWQIWDRNYDTEQLDCYHGAFGVINLLNQRKNFGAVSKAFVDLKPTLNFLLWDSEISYTDNIWVKDKAYDYIMNPTHIPQRQAITSDGYWCGFLIRPENTEATSCKLRVSYSGNFYYYTVTPDMWETVNYAQRTTQLSQLPNTDKDFHYFIIKLDSTTIPANTTTTSTTIPANTTTTSTTTFGGSATGFTLTQPKRVANYYKAPSGTTEIIPSYYLNFDDNVYLENDKIKVGFSLRGGGAITYFSQTAVPLNIINNAGDGGIGRQIQPDYYQSPSTFHIDGKQQSPFFPNNGYNTTLGGDDFRNVATLLDYYPITNGYYIKFKPLIWGINGHISEITIEVTYVLTDSTLHATYKYTSERTDSQIITPDPVSGNTVGQAIPAIYLNKFFTEIQTYDGTNTWTNASPTVRTIASNAKNTTSYSLTTFDATEKWVAVVSPTKNLAMGVYTPILGYVRSERRNMVNETLVDDKDDACTIVEILDSPRLPDSHNKWGRTDEVYYTLDTVTAIRAKAYALSGYGTTVVPTGFKMREPNKPQYYFSNNHAPSYYNNVSNLPAIHRSETHPESVPTGKLLSGLTMSAKYNMTEDLVWLENDQIKIGINLKRGGHIAWASQSGSNENMVYNGYDGGFQVGGDFYTPRDGYTQEGQISGQEIGTIYSYNVTHGGDFKNNSVSLIDYHPTPNGYYVKLRPIHYPLRGLMSETYIEVTYTLTSNAVKCDYKYTSFRTDNQQDAGTVGWGVPACFLVNTLNKYATYNGSNPFTNDSALTIGSISDVSTAGKCGVITANNATENWIMSYNQNTGIGFGVYNATDIDKRARMEVKQCEVYLPDGAGTEFIGGFTFMQPAYSYYFPANTSFTKSSTAYILIGTVASIRNKVYQINSL